MAWPRAACSGGLAPLAGAWPDAIASGIAINNQIAVINVSFAAPFGYRIEYEPSVFM
jgi:hypothetical protein